MTQLLLLTGQRRGEVAAMRWREVDLDGKVWTLPKERCKNGVEHVVPLSDPTVAILQGLPRIAGKEGFVFSTNGAAPVSGFAKGKELTLPPSLIQRPCRFSRDRFHQTHPRNPPRNAPTPTFKPPVELGGLPRPCNPKHRAAPARFTEN